MDGHFALASMYNQRLGSGLGFFKLFALDD